MNDGRSHDAHVAGRSGARAADYVASAVHARGEDLAARARIAADKPDARVLDLGCGGGHVAYAVAPGVAEVTAYDLSQEMLDAVAVEAARAGEHRRAAGQRRGAAFRRCEPEPVIRHFGVEADGSFWLDTMLIEAEPDGNPTVSRPPAR